MRVTQYTNTNYHIKLAIQKIKEEIHDATKARPMLVDKVELDITTYRDIDDPDSIILDTYHENLEVPGYYEALQFFSDATELGKGSYEIIKDEYPILVVRDIYTGHYIRVEEYIRAAYCVEGYYPDYTKEEMDKFNDCIKTLESAIKSMSEVKDIIKGNKRTNM
jgi:hypothetical protein